jgi:hypothetical protein
MRSGVWAFVLAVFACVVAARASADQTTVGVTVNGTTGAHIESDRTESLPFLPLPMIEVQHSHKNLLVRLEGLPPVGPVPLAQGGGFFDGSPSPRVSYVDGDVLYRLPNRRFAFGIGETVFNQRTLYPPTTFVQSSRVVGMRYVASALLWSGIGSNLRLNVAVNPALQGMQTGYAAEYGSLVDASLRWSVRERRLLFVYGVRYLNYTAAYRFDNSLADRNHLFMPFAGVDVPLGRQRVADPAASPAPYRPAATPAHVTSVRLALLGTNGSRSFTDSYSDAPLAFDLLPEVSLAQAFGRYEIRADGIPPNAGANPFGSSQQRWSYLDVDALVRSRNGRFAFGVGNTVTNLRPLFTGQYENQHARTEALGAIWRAVLAQSLRDRIELQVRVEPYVHAATYISFAPPPPAQAFSKTIADHGARVDLTIAYVSQARPAGFTFGLRYVNQTTNYGPFNTGFNAGAPGAFLARSTSLMPFAGLIYTR